MNVTLSKYQQLELIDKVFYKLKDKLESLHHGLYHSQYYELNHKEEKRHLGIKPSEIENGLTLAQGARLFYVKQLVEALYIENSHKYTVKDILHVRASAIFAQSLSENYRDELFAEIKGLNLDGIIAVDYAELQKV